MRTTLTLDDDILIAARAIAAQERKSIGEIISALARRSLHRSASAEERNGIPLLRSRPGVPVVTLDVVNTLRDDPP